MSGRVREKGMKKKMYANFILYTVFKHPFTNSHLIIVHTLLFSHSFFFFSSLQTKIVNNKWKMVSGKDFNNEKSHCMIMFSLDGKALGELASLHA